VTDPKVKRFMTADDVPFRATSLAGIWVIGAFLGAAANVVTIITAALTPTLCPGQGSGLESATMPVGGELGPRRRAL